MRPSVSRWNAAACCSAHPTTSQAVRSPNIAECHAISARPPHAHRGSTNGPESGMQIIGFITHTRTRSRIRRPPISRRPRTPSSVHLIVGFVDGKAEVRLFNYKTGGTIELLLIPNS